jgi:hypothetical protein
MPFDGNVDKIGQVLTRAADLLEERGWCQGELTNDQGQHCALGAIVEVAGGESAVREHLQFYRGILPRIEDIIGEPDLLLWNDESGRTPAEVVAVLRAAARFGAGTRNPGSVRMSDHRRERKRSSLPKQKAPETSSSAGTIEQERRRRP